MTTAIATATEVDDLVGIEAAAVAAGVSYRAIYRWRERGLLTVYRSAVGRRSLVSLTELRRLTEVRPDVRTTARE